MDKNEAGNDFNYVQEKIKPKTKRKVKKVLEVAGLSFLAALIFGVTARFAFVLSGDTVSKVLGIEVSASTTPGIENPRNQVILGEASGPSVKKNDNVTPVATTVITKEPEITVTTVPTATEEPTASPTPAVTPKPTEAVTPEVTPVPQKQEKEEKKEESPIETYLRMMGSLKELAANASESLVDVKAITSGLNWMDENVETTKENTGVVMADNGVELLIMTSYNKLVGADRIDVEFRNGTVVSGVLFSKDSDYDLAVVAVELTDLDEEIIEALKYIEIGDSSALCEGEPVIAVGRPNGYIGSVEFGFISSTDKLAYIPDGVTEFFVTDMIYNDSSDGIIINLEGKMIGFISHAVGNGSEEKHCTAVEIGTVNDIILRLLNGQDIPYIGVRAENMPIEVLEVMGLENGIYVNEVISTSPAYTAGLRKGDVIISIDNKKINNVKDYNAKLMEIENGSKHEIAVYRGSNPGETNIVISVRVGRK